MNLKKVLISALLLFVFAPVIAQTDKSLLYEISGNGLEKPSYLFGTFHLLKSDYIKEQTLVNEKYEAADQVVVEMLVDSSMMMSFTMKAMMPGKSLKAIMNEKSYEKLGKELSDGLGMDIAMFDQFKPAFVSTLLAQIMANEEIPSVSKYKGELMDLYFANHGAKNNKKVIPLETMMEQASILFESKSPEEQAKELEEMIEHKGQSNKMMRKMGKYYMDNNLPGLLEIGKEYEEEYEGMTLLVDKRNIKWMENLPAILKEGNAFIAVGALHLPGDRGLIELLLKDGYTVKAVK